jgi:hypothetical protein
MAETMTRQSSKNVEEEEDGIVIKLDNDKNMMTMMAAARG